MALNHLQDFVAETVTVPWPAVAHEIPMPWVVVSEDEISLGFGGEVMLPPIARSDLQKRPGAAGSPAASNRGT